MFHKICDVFIIFLTNAINQHTWAKVCAFRYHVDENKHEKVTINEKLDTRQVVQDKCYDIQDTSALPSRLVHVTFPDPDFTLYFTNTWFNMSSREVTQMVGRLYLVHYLQHL